MHRTRSIRFDKSNVPRHIWWSDSQHSTKLVIDWLLISLYPLNNESSNYCFHDLWPLHKSCSLSQLIPRPFPSGWADILTVMATHFINVRPTIQSHPKTSKACWDWRVIYYQAYPECCRKKRFSRTVGCWMQLITKKGSVYQNTSLQVSFIFCFIMFFFNLIFITIC